MFRWLSNNQHKEIKTIAPREITLKLSDADCERLSIISGRAGLTVSELVEAFIGDLVEGTYSNGSDERDLAQQWYERCGYEQFHEEQLLYHLLNNYYDPEDYIDTLNEIDNVKENIKITEKNIETADNEWKKIVYHVHDEDSDVYKEVQRYASAEEYIAAEKDDLRWLKLILEELEEELKLFSEDWKPDTVPDMEKEIKRIRAWIDDKHRLEKAKSIDQNVE